MKPLPNIILSEHPLIWFAAIIGGAMVHALFATRKELKQDPEEEPNENGMRFWDHKRGYFYFYRGKHLAFTATEIEAICMGHSRYFQLLSAEKRSVFIQRLQSFIWSKEFYIVGTEGYKEMPILVSAAATQIMFGLADYTLPHFIKLVIHPQEYLGYEPLRVLAGNVKGRAIILSWKHFIQDFQKPYDGQNVGLHEMAHALQVQHLFQNYGYVDQEFRADYTQYDAVDDWVLKREQLNTESLFSPAALQDPNEFWACSVELFFERPEDLQRLHPELYQSICQVLNQDMVALVQGSSSKP